MNLQRTISARLLLLLSGTIPVLLLASKPGMAENISPEFQVESRNSTPALNVAPNLDYKLQKISPLGLPNQGAYVQDKGPTWVQYIQHKGGSEIFTNPAVLQPSAVDTFRSFGKQNGL